MSDNYFSVLIITVIYCAQLSVIDGLECYTCTANTAGSDCELHPDKVPGGITDCNKKYCTLRRVEYISSGKVYSYYRSCEDNPVYMNNVIEDDTYRTYFYACSTALCNGSTGAPASSGGSGGQSLPPGVTKPPFNDRVLHGLGQKAAIHVALIVLGTSFVFLVNAVLS